MLAKVVDGSFGRFRHALHELLFYDVPLVVLQRCGVNPHLADASICTANTDVLVGTSEASAGMSLEVRECHQGIIIGEVSTYRHLLEPLATLYW